MEINGASPVFNPSTSSSTGTTGKNSVNAQDFYKLLITQLQSQDPMKPADNQAILQQVSMIKQLESSDQLTKTLGGMSTDQRLGSTSALIGKYVTGTPDTAGGDSTPIEGVVVAVSYTSDGQATLELHNGQRLPADHVQAVTLVENLQGAQGNGLAAGADPAAAAAAAAAQSKAKAGFPLLQGLLGAAYPKAVN